MQKWVYFLVLFLVGCAPFDNTVLTGFQTKKECPPGMKLGREVLGTAWCEGVCDECVQEKCPAGMGRNNAGACSCWEKEWCCSMTVIVAAP